MKSNMKFMSSTGANGFRYITFRGKKIFYIATEHLELVKSSLHVIVHKAKQNLKMISSFHINITLSIKIYIKIFKDFNKTVIQYKF